jgi:putative hydrolase of the HAD superfamily
MRTLGLANAVDGIQYSAQIGAKKPDTAFFHGTALAVRMMPADILLIDDTPENIRAAQACGWNAVLWTGEGALLDVLKEHFPTKLPFDELQKPCC